MSAKDYRAPWSVSSPPNDTHAFDVFDSNGTKIHHGHWGARGVAFLVSAAPDLLEALKGVRDAPLSTKAIHAMHAAIAKAEGQS